jgi:hypothetical protein
MNKNLTSQIFNSADPLNETALALPIVGLVLAIACLILPIRWLIDKCVDQNSALENEKLYTEHVFAFPTDYDC